KLTPAQKSAAKAKAKAAGRPYPNLIDNAAVAKKSKKK
ncbi:MAG: DNA-binding protein, partial [Betaproteobacteria bacterium]|nr:DNA-binding protein [Betaproteobacteria bacterium]